MHRVGLILVSVVMSLTSCSSHDASRYGTPSESKVDHLQDSGLSGTPKASSRMEAERIISQYRKFWNVSLPAAYEAPVNKRPDVLAATVSAGLVAPLMERISKLEATGRTAYGSDIPVSEQVEYSKRTGGYVLVRGCLDSSRTGVADVATGRRITVGVPRNPVFVNLRRTVDGDWLVTSFHFPGGQCG